MKTMTFSEFFEKKPVFEGLTQQEIQAGETFKFLFYVLIALLVVTGLPVLTTLPIGVENAFLQWK
jgi:hypothetical protein